MGLPHIAVSRTGNELGLSAQQLAALPADELAARERIVIERFRAASAHAVAPSVADCLPAIEALDARLARGERP